jgi:hypothetical protein
MRQESEALIQQQIFIWFNNTYRNLIIHSVPNGSSTGDARIISQMSQLGMVKGISDLIIWLPNGKSIMVEVKNSTGSQSADQIKIQQKLEKLGGIYILVRSLDDFKQKISLYLTNP